MALHRHRSKTLSPSSVTIRTQLDLDIDPQTLRRSEPEDNELRAFLQRFEFNSWLQELGEDEQAEAPDTEYETVDTEEALARWLKQLERAELIAFDTETTALDPMRAELVGLSFCVDEGKAAYVPVAHDYPGAPAQLDRDAVLAALKPILEDPDLTLLSYPFRNVTFVAWNARRPQLADPRVRQALTLATHRQEIVQNILEALRQKYNLPRAGMI